MTEFRVTATRITKITDHHSDDRLSVAKVFDYSVVIRRGTRTVGDLVVYLPIGSIVPDNETFSFLFPRNDEGVLRFSLGETPLRYRSIKAKKIKGIVSLGLIVDLPEGTWVEGDNLAYVMGITKDDSDDLCLLSSSEESEPNPFGWNFRTYTDIEHAKRHPGIFESLGRVAVTEKIHGANARYVHDGQRLWVGSHKQIKRKKPDSQWWKVALQEDLERKLSKFPMKIFFGEIYGKVQNLRYDSPDGLKFKAFDVFDISSDSFMNHDDAVDTIISAGIEHVPILYKGIWKQSLFELSDKPSELGGGISEGIIIKPVREMLLPGGERAIFKLHGDKYLLGKK
jgi:RNA ligase (TIGR02306 family)